MSTAIQPTTPQGKRRRAARRARQAWAQLRQPTWSGLTTAEKLDAIRDVLIFVLRREFHDIDD